MGLDDFMDIDSGDTEDKQTETDDDNEESDLLEHENFRDDDGEIKKNGPLGYESFEKYEETIEEELAWKKDLYKYRLPIFPRIEMEEKYETGTRYRAFKGNETISCITKSRLRLANIAREIIMLDTGHVEKEDCINELESRFDTMVTPGTTVHLYFFNQTRNICKLAIADSMTDDWSLQNKDHVLKAMYDEAYTQEFRESEDIDDRLVHTDFIDPW